MTYILYERKKYHESDRIMYHTQWFKVAVFSSKNKIKKYIDTRARCCKNWEYKINDCTEVIQDGTV